MEELRQYGGWVEKAVEDMISRREKLATVSGAMGLVIGLVALVLFVFGGSSESIDAPSIDHTTPAGPPAATTPK